MQGLTLWLVRHGQSTANAGLPADGRADAALTALGREQALAVALKIPRQPDLLVVSPMRRAIETAEPIRDRWPAVRHETWPISEFTYLSPSRCEGTTASDRREWVDTYWKRGEPLHADGDDAESFSALVERVRAFHLRVSIQKGFVVVVGHGQFLRAYALWANAVSWDATPQLMRDFRSAETAQPMENGEIIEIAGRFTARAGE